MKGLSRLGTVALTLLGAATAVFFLLRAMPGDPAAALAGEHADPESLARIRERWGLDRPVAVQYGRFLLNLLRLDLGESIATGRAVTAEIAERLPATAELALAAVLLALLAGIPLGILAAARAGGKLDAAVLSATTVGVSAPVFALGYALILAKVFWGLPFVEISGRTGALGTGGGRFLILPALLSLDGAALSEALAHLALPALALSTVPLSSVARLARAATLSALRDPWIRTARAKGLSPRRVLWVHALPNAAIPIVTAAGLQAGYLLGGAVLTETVFSWPGLGSLLSQAVGARDYPLLQGLTLLSAATFIAVNACVELAYRRLDPRLR